MVLLNVDSAMLNLVSMQWNNPDISDIKLKLGTSTVHSHKFILASHSSVFKAMLYGKNFLENKKDVLEITNFNSAILTEVLKSLYTRMNSEIVTYFRNNRIIFFYCIGSYCNRRPLQPPNNKESCI